FLPVRIMVYGPPAVIFGKATTHLPSLSVTVDAVVLCSPRITSSVTFSPGSAVPHTLQFMPCCNTMPSPKSVCGLTSALAGRATAAGTNGENMNRCFIAATPWKCAPQNVRANETSGPAGPLVAPLIGTLLLVFVFRFVLVFILVLVRRLVLVRILLAEEEFP